MTNPKNLLDYAQTEHSHFTTQKRMKSQKIVEDPDPEVQTYDVGKLLAENPNFKLYACDLGPGQAGLVKIATTAAADGVLDREAYLLRMLAEYAQALEEEYAKVKTDEKVMLNYQFYFPRLIKSFISDDNEARRVNILSFSSIATEMTDLAVLSMIRERDYERVDPKTSVWILGKLLKLLSFLHLQGISGVALDTNNILINRDRHIVALFDWTNVSLSSPGTLAADVTSSEIARVARSVISILGGNEKTFSIPDDEQLTDTRYAECLKNLASGAESDANKAHQEFYDLVCDLWPRAYHPYTAYKL